MGKQFLATTLLSLLFICNGANAQKTKQETDPNTSRGIDLTEIVVTALVLGFGYSVLQGFKSKNG